MRLLWRLNGSNSMTEFPTVFYKYVPPERVDILLNQKIRVTPPDELNDPFDCRPVIVPPTNNSKFITDQAKDFESRNIRFPWFQAKWHAKSLKYSKSFRDFHANSVFNTLGILSLSSVPDNPIMWSHYCMNHRGFVIGIRNDWVPFINQNSEGYGYPPVPVIYDCPNRPVFEIHSDNDVLQVLNKKALTGNTSKNGD